ncbi:MAG: AMP-binding protein, partial [Pseudomonadota bacterium]
MSGDLFPIPEAAKKKALIDNETYLSMYKESVEDPSGFWAKHGKRLDWIKPYSRVKSTNYAYADVNIRWFDDGSLNVAANCIDRHLETRGDQTAIIWEPDSPDEEAKYITYKELHREVSIFANVLKELGVGKGDRVVIYLPMIPEAAYAMLACARIGAIHSIVFAGFSPDALADRINGCQASLVITADEAPRGGRNTPLKTNADKALRRVMHNCKLLEINRPFRAAHHRQSRAHLPMS